MSGARGKFLRAQRELFLPRFVEFPIPFQFSAEASFARNACVRSSYAPRAGFVKAERVQFWRELVAMARRVRVRVPVIVVGDANVWHPYFTLGRSRSADNAIVPSSIC